MSWNLYFIKDSNTEEDIKPVLQMTHVIYVSRRGTLMPVFLSSKQQAKGSSKVESGNIRLSLFPRQGPAFFSSS